MRDAIYLDTNDIKGILAEKYDVPETNIVKAQYSFTIILDDSNGGGKKDEHNT